MSFICSLWLDTLNLQGCRMAAFVSVLKKLMHSEGQGMYGCEVSGKYKAEIHYIVY